MVGEARKTRRFGDQMGDVSSLMSRKGAGKEEGTGLLLLDAEVIHPDPDQPRKADNPGFTKESIEELAASMKVKVAGKPRGVKSPISVRPHPDIKGEYIINHGERRWRAATLAKVKVPAYVDGDYSKTDQVLENIAREDLTSREVADFIGREIAGGKSKSQIAKDLGRSPAFVTQHAALLDLPEPIADAHTAGRVSDVTVINELVRAHKSNSELVEQWLDDADQEITRGSVKTLREFLDHQKDAAGQGEGGDDDGGQGGEGEGEGEESKAKPKPKPDPEKLKKAVVQCEYQGRDARLVTDRRPKGVGQVWIRFEDDGEELDVKAADIRLTGIIEG